SSGNTTNGCIGTTRRIPWVMELGIQGGTSTRCAPPSRTRSSASSKSFPMSTRFASVALAALAVLAAGCGGTSATDRGMCQGRLLDRANAAAVDRMFAAGKLGTRTQVQQELGRSASFGYTQPKQLLRFGAKFFDANGRLKPYDRLTSRQQGAFNDFMYRNDR